MTLFFENGVKIEVMILFEEGPVLLTNGLAGSRHDSSSMLSDALLDAI